MAKEASGEDEVMPLYEFHCSICGFSADYITSMGTELVCCPNCQGEASKQFSFGSSYAVREDGEWFPSVLEVIDKESRDPIDREFLKNPNRKNYRAWMQHHGLRHVENERGGPPTFKKPESDIKEITDYCFEQKRKRERIEVRS